MLKSLYRWIFWIVFLSLLIALGLGIWYSIDITKRFLNPLIQTKTDEMYIVKANTSRTNLEKIPFEHELLLMNLLLDSMNAHLNLKAIYSANEKTRQKTVKKVQTDVFKSLVEELNKLHYSYTDYQALRKNCVKTLTSRIPIKTLKETSISQYSNNSQQQKILLNLMKSFENDYIFSDSVRSPAYSYVKEYTVESIKSRMVPVLIGFDKRP